MKSILVTDKVYDQLESIADEQNELIEVMACLYLERGMGELDRINEEIKSLKAKTELTEAMLESKQDPRRQ